MASLLLVTGCSTPSPEVDIDYAELRGIDELRIENAERAVSCLAEKGFPGAVVLPDGSTSSQVTEEQADHYDTAARECAAELCPTCGELTDSQLGVVYELAVASRECLAEEGFPTSEVPTLQTYIERYRTDDPWSPHAEAARPIAESRRMNELRELCPDPFDAIPYLSDLTD